MGCLSMKQGAYWQSPELWPSVSHEDASNDQRISRLQSRRVSTYPSPTCGDHLSRITPTLDEAKESCVPFRDLAAYARAIWLEPGSTTCQRDQAKTEPTSLHPLI